ncbi:lipopolysaccharide biosynthesis protein RfbH [Bacillus velezensis]|uniref:lipopolysaccharide biosynthesis protein RfbH n=1 Tax=Bacillus velezensis TaxID=492670 RepID=UPI0039AFD1FC
MNNLKIGKVYSINESKKIVIELNQKSFFCYEISTSQDSYKINKKHLEEFTYQEVQKENIKEIDNIVIDEKTFDEALRIRINNKIKDYYNLFHKYQVKDKIAYSGKVYDQDELISATNSVLDFWLTSGEKSKLFEKELGHFLQVKYVNLTNSGSSANLLAISALTSNLLGERRLVKGDEVITVAAGFPTTIFPIIQNNLIPVFLDIDLETYNINCDDLEKSISSKTKAIMLAHTMGNPFNIEEIIKVAKKYNLWIIEDNCDALGSEYLNKKTGSFGDISTCSFYPPHHITMGEGGAICTNNNLLNKIIKSFRDWGRDCWCESGKDNTCGKRFCKKIGDLPMGYDHKYIYSHIGYNLKATDIQASIGREQLKKISYFTKKRRENFKFLKDKLKKYEKYLILPSQTPQSHPSWFGFIITVKDPNLLNRNEIVQYLEKNNVQTRMLFAGNILRQPALKEVKYKKIGDLKNTDKVMNDSFLVGVYPGITKNDLEFIAKKIIESIRLQCNRNSKKELEENKL